MNYILERGRQCEDNGASHLKKKFHYKMKENMVNITREIHCSAEFQEQSVSFLVDFLEDIICKLTLKDLSG